MPDDAKGGPTRPIHISLNTWEEQSRKLEELIRFDSPFEGKWQGYIDNGRLYIPEELRKLFNSGGVITVSTEDHLMLFGSQHWLRYQRVLSKENGLSPVLNDISRHVFSNMHRFHKLNDDGSLDIPSDLIQYANLGREVAIIGMIYHAEIHDKDSFIKSQKLDALLERKKRFKLI